LTGIRRIDHVLSTGMAGVATMTVTAKTTFMTATGIALAGKVSAAAFEQAKPRPGTPEDLPPKTETRVRRQEPLKLLSGVLFLVHCPCMKMACVL
jgi:hypothetical protein